MERNNIASIAYRFGQGRLPLQRCIGGAPWDEVPLRQALTRQGAAPLGQDDEMGRPSWFRRRLARLGERSMLAVPGNTLIRDLETAPLASSGRRRPPTPPWQRVEVWRAALDEGAWQRIAVRDGSTGPLGVAMVKRRVVARTPRRPQGDAELLVVLRDRDRDRDNQQGVKVDFSLSNATPGTPLWQLARVAKAEQRIEECLQRSKSEAGLADDEGRNGPG